MYNIIIGLPRRDHWEGWAPIHWSVQGIKLSSNGWTQSGWSGASGMGHFFFLEQRREDNLCNHASRRRADKKETKTGCLKLLLQWINPLQRSPGEYPLGLTEGESCDVWTNVAWFRGVPSLLGLYVDVVTPSLKLKTFQKNGEFSMNYIIDRRWPCAFEVLSCSWTYPIKNLEK